MYLARNNLFQQMFAQGYNMCSKILFVFYHIVSAGFIFSYRVLVSMRVRIIPDCSTLIAKELSFASTYISLGVTSPWPSSNLNSTSEEPSENCNKFHNWVGKEKLIYSEVQRELILT